MGKIFKVVRLLIFCICSVVCLLFASVQASGQDYFRVRNDPNLQVILDNRTVDIDSKTVHTQLSAKAADKRAEFERGNIVRLWKDSRETLGNIATARLDFIFENDSVMSYPVTNRTHKGEYFTTITLGNIESYIMNDLKNSFTDFFKPVFGIDFYPDTEAQIADVFLLSTLYITSLQSACKDKDPSTLKVVVLHIYTELDPCSKCRLLWSYISDEMNKKGYNGFITDGLERLLAQIKKDRDRIEKAKLIEELKLHGKEPNPSWKLEKLRSELFSLINPKEVGKPFEKRELKDKIARHSSLLRDTETKERIFNQRYSSLLGEVQKSAELFAARPRFIVVMSSSRLYEDARTLCLDEFSIPEAKDMPSIIDLRSKPTPLTGTRRLAVIKTPYCITHFLDSYLYSQRYEVIPGMTLWELAKEQETG